MLSRKEVKMEKQTAIYLNEKDIKRLEQIKETRETSKTTDIIKLLIKEEYARILIYKGIM